MNWLQNASRYEWKEEYGEIALGIGELEAEPFQEELQNVTSLNTYS